MNYRLAYRIGFQPWEDAATDPPFVEKISGLFDREEKGRQPPFGLALDLGTGSGIRGIELAKRGWQVTGIDIVDRALQRARERVKEAGVEMRLVHGDVTALRASTLRISTLPRRTAGPGRVPNAGSNSNLSSRTAGDAIRRDRTSSRVHVPIWLPGRP